MQLEDPIGKIIRNGERKLEIIGVVDDFHYGSLLGLATFTSDQRKREIGIRKVLGQTATEVSLLLSGEFAKLILIAICIGFP